MSVRKRDKRIKETIHLLEFLGLPKAQLNERSALTLLALLNLTPDKSWTEAEAVLIGVTPIMDWVKVQYKKNYAPNTRETFRRQTLHQFCDAGICVYNPDKPDRAVNSPNAVYSVTPQALQIIQSYGGDAWDQKLAVFLSQTETLVSKYANERSLEEIPILTPNGKVHLSPGNHNKLIRKIIEEFAPVFVPGSELVYVGDTGKKWGHFDDSVFKRLGIEVDPHGKMPDVILFFSQKNWLVLVEAVTSHGPVDGKRHHELSKLFANPVSGIVYVTAFPSRSQLSRYISEISWETEVWVADSPTHLIHFNGHRFLGPYSS